ncbi:MAG: hypothetical protein CM15mP83_5860 [Flavobacteriaceae bacterium]|nr:MAG: hypothetical protein CM15mP83_5860 [Flavobacteriaceae bacterium]
MRRWCSKNHRQSKSQPHHQFFFAEEVSPNEYTTDLWGLSEENLANVTMAIKAF